MGTNTADYENIRDRELSRPETHTLVKEIVKMAETRDSVDAYYDIKLALALAQRRMERDLKPTGAERI